MGRQRPSAGHQHHNMADINSKSHRAECLTKLLIMQESKLTARFDISSTSKADSSDQCVMQPCFSSAEQWQPPERRDRDTPVVPCMTFFRNKWRWNNPCMPVTCCRGHHNNINAQGGWEKGEDTPTHPLFTVARPKLALVSPASREHTNTPRTWGILADRCHRTDVHR